PNGAHLITEKLLVGAAIALAATVITATPADAEPSQFDTLGCSCDPATGTPHDPSDLKSQVDAGIQHGLGSLRASPLRPGD
ncbi:MAG TPA: hypothetical protein VE908_13815, partial [Mycobacterium sp.]|nr:hypothetical protein [Mycobacterium sp.]